MLSRCLSRTANICLQTLNSSNKSSYPLLLHPSPSPLPNFSFKSSLFFSTNRNNNGGGGDDPSSSNSWTISPDNDEELGSSLFKDDGGDFTGFTNDNGGFSEKPERNSVNRSDVDVSVDSWSKDDSKPINLFGEVDKEFEVKKSDGADDDEWETAQGYKPWSFDEEVEKSEVFDIGEDIKGLSLSEDEEEIEDIEKLEEEEKELTPILKGNF